jgi:hypothetical protein
MIVKGSIIKVLYSCFSEIRDLTSFITSSKSEVWKITPPFVSNIFTY